MSADCIFASSCWRVDSTHEIRERQRQTSSAWQGIEANDGQTGNSEGDILQAVASPIDRIIESIRWCDRAIRKFVESIEIGRAARVWIANRGH
jgi:hypothetical protein